MEKCTCGHTRAAHTSTKCSVCICSCRGFTVPADSPPQTLVVEQADGVQAGDKAEPTALQKRIADAIDKGWEDYEFNADLAVDAVQDLFCELLREGR